MLNTIVRTHKRWSDEITAGELTTA
jgi:hypothetical protein